MESVVSSADELHSASCAAKAPLTKSYINIALPRQPYCTPYSLPISSHQSVSVSHNPCTCSSQCLLAPILPHLLFEMSPARRLHKVSIRPLHLGLARPKGLVSVHPCFVIPVPASYVTPCASHRRGLVVVRSQHCRPRSNLKYRARLAVTIHSLAFHVLKQDVCVPGYLQAMSHSAATFQENLLPDILDHDNVVKHAVLNVREPMLLPMPQYPT